MSAAGIAQSGGALAPHACLLSAVRRHQDLDAEQNSARRFLSFANQ
jgi:hypothetical protein